MTPLTAGATVDVGVEPDDAFRVFTAEIGRWYVIEAGTVQHPALTRDIRLEPGVDGRLLDVRDTDVLELGRVTAWEPGARLAFTDTEGTDVEVTFTARRGGTRVVLEHRGLERVPPERRRQVARFGWRLLIPWYADHLRLIKGQDDK